MDRFLCYVQYCCYFEFFYFFFIEDFDFNVKFFKFGCFVGEFYWFQNVGWFIDQVVSQNDVICYIFCGSLGFVCVFDVGDLQCEFQIGGFFVVIVFFCFVGIEIV